MQCSQIRFTLARTFIRIAPDNPQLADDAAAGRVHAKTGSLMHVSALSGYVQRKDESWVMFSILVNGFTAHSTDVHAVMDRICDSIVE